MGNGWGASDDERPEQGWQLAEEADRLQALGVHRPDAGPAVVVVPRDRAGDEARALGELGDGPDRPPAVVVTSRFTAGEVRDLMHAIAERDWSPEAKRYRYGFGYDAELDAIVISTDAPEAERAAIADRFADRVQIQPAEPVPLPSQPAMEPPRRGDQLRLRAAGRGATTIVATVLDDGGDAVSADGAGRSAVQVLFALLPLELWERTVQQSPILDYDRVGVAYEVLRWEARREVTASSGASAHEVYAELRQINTTRDVRLL